MSPFYVTPKWHKKTEKYKVIWKKGISMVHAPHLENVQDFQDFDQDFQDFQDFPYLEYDFQDPMDLTSPAPPNSRIFRILSKCKLYP